MKYIKIYKKHKNYFYIKSVHFDDQFHMSPVLKALIVPWVKLAMLRKQKANFIGR